MIFVLALLVALTVWQYFLTARRQGRGRVFREIAAAVFAGGVSGILIGVAARLGMAAIGLANGAARFSFSGSIAVVISFAGFGVILGIIYAGLLRRLLRASGLAYGCLLVLSTWYPLAEAAVEELASKPATAGLVLISGVVVVGMWVPYAIVLERLICWRHGGMAMKEVPEAAV
ncbi:MAG TPA: hypothetical protein VJ464_20770 [Blastocatellia bacterium]|nr:hypothetical protein [Blastocatellia bacterium]